MIFRRLRIDRVIFSIMFLFSLNGCKKNESVMTQPVIIKPVPVIVSAETTEPVPGLAAARHSNNLAAAFYYEGKCGLIDSEMNVLVPPKYDYIDYVDYSNLYEFYNKGELLHHIYDGKGNEIFQTESICLHNGRFCSGGTKSSGYYIQDLDTGKRFLLDKTFSGRPFDDSDLPLTIPVDLRNHTSFCIDENFENKLFDDGRFAGIYFFNNGRAVAWDKNKKLFVIDHGGNIIRKDFLATATHYSEGLLAVVLKDGRTGFIDTEGNFVIDIPFNIPDGQRGFTIYSFHEGVSVFITVESIEDESDMMIIDKKGNVLGKFKSRSLNPCSCGLIAQENKKIGYCDLNGKTVIANIFSISGGAINESYNFKNGYAAVKYNDRDVLLDVHGNVYYTADVIAGNKEPAFSSWIEN